MANEGWHWRYSRWTGIMYGPIPVGIIGVVVVLGVMYGGGYM